MRVRRWGEHCCTEGGGGQSQSRARLEDKEELDGVDGGVLEAEQKRVTVYDIPGRCAHVNEGCCSSGR